jgi:hypothetical protein
MPRKIKQLAAGDGKIVAYDDRVKRFFLVKLEPLDLEVLEKEEVIEAVKMVLCGEEPDAVV